MAAAWSERGTVLIKLGPHHFAFYRGYLDGLDIKTLAHRYLETHEDDAGIDLRVAKSMVRWIWSQLMVTARRTGNTSAAKLLRVAPEALRIQYASHVPTLDQFREERDPDEMYSERDLIELFQDEYSKSDVHVDRRSQRNNRIRAKQIAVLNRLESLVSANPHLDDGVDGWLDPVLATRLIAVHIHTLDNLINAINNHGFHWYAKVPRIGVKAAKQIVDWLMLPETVASIGKTLSARGIYPRTALTPALLSDEPAPLQTAIVPLENFLVPHELSGTSGSNRGERPSLSARNDLEAIKVWLLRRKPGSHTFRAYRKEAERFLLWAVLEAQKPVSSLSVEDCIGYRNFLWNLGRQTPQDWARYFRIPQEKWLGQRGIDRFSPRWRPFEGPLSASSQKTALVIIQSMMSWLVEQDYLHSNPFKALPHLAKRPVDGIDISRTLTIAAWKSVKAYLSLMKPDQRYYRLRFVLALAYSTGCRLSELVSLQRADLRSFTRAGENELQWEIVVTGKGDVRRMVQLNSYVMQEIRQYFSLRGHVSFADVPPTTPLIAALPLPNVAGTADDPLSGTRLYKVLKTFFVEVAQSVQEEEPEMAASIRSASTHWLRHTFATHGIHNGMSLATVRDLLGHKSLTTTSVYVTTEKDKRSREVEMLGDLAAF